MREGYRAGVDVARDPQQTVITVRPDVPYRSSWPINHEGTCDGCAEGKPLVMAYDVDDHNEPWLCAECAKGQP